MLTHPAWEHNVLWLDICSKDQLFLASCRSAIDVNNLLAGVQYTGLTPLASAMQAKVLQPIVYNLASSGQLQKPVLILTITGTDHITLAHKAYWSHHQLYCCLSTAHCPLLPQYLMSKPFAQAQPASACSHASILTQYLCVVCVSVQTVSLLTIRVTW